MRLVTEVTGMCCKLQATQFENKAKKKQKKNQKTKCKLNEK